MNLGELNREILDDIREWSRGRNPIFRIILLLFFLYIGIRHLADPMFNSIFKSLNLGIHELGHIVFGPFGEFLSIAGGTILQCLMPVISMLMFYNQRDYFAIAISFGWLSTNLYDVATYMADARSLSLPLVSPFGTENIVHDWNYLLNVMGLLQWDTKLAFCVRILAFLSMVICIGFGSWIVKNMLVRKDG